MTGLSDQGLTIKRLDEIKNELDTGLRLIFGQELSLDPSTPEAQLNGIIAEDITVLYELAQAVYMGLNPSFSSGNMLDLVSQIRGIQRKPATATRVEIQTVGTPGALIPEGTLFAASGIPNITFSLEADIVVPELGTIVCSETGLIVVPINTLREIVTPISGLISVNNPTAGVTGTEQETDEEFRIRSNASVALPGRAILDSMQAGLSNIDGVEKAIVYENTSERYDYSTGTGAKSMRAIVLGGGDQAIAETIFFRKSLGCGMNGAVSVPVNDIHGLPHSIRFDRPALIDIFVSVKITKLLGWNQTQEDIIKQAIVDFANGEHCNFAGYTIGQSVYSAELYGALLSYPTFTVTEILVDTATPVSANFVLMELDELARFDVVNIGVI